MSFPLRTDSDTFKLLIKMQSIKSTSVFHIDPRQLDRHGHPAKWKIYFAQSMLVFAIVTRIFLVLQIQMLFESKTSNGLSAISYSIYIFSMMLWTFYAISVLKTINWPLVISSVLGLILAVVILIGIFIFPYMDMSHSTITPTPTNA